MNNDFDAFFAQHERRIHYQIRRLHIPYQLYDDFFSEGLVAMWRAYDEYDESRANIGTFLNYRIRFRLIDLQRHLIREQEKIEIATEAQMVEQHSGNRDRSRNDFLIDVRGIELPDDTFWRDVRVRLSDNQWKWVKYYVIRGLSIKEIAHLENVSEVAVKSWARETRRKLRNETFRERFTGILRAGVS